jgi:hypothetical protein
MVAGKFEVILFNLIKGVLPMVSIILLYHISVSALVGTMKIAQKIQILRNVSKMKLLDKSGNRKDNEKIMRR